MAGKGAANPSRGGQLLALVRTHALKAMVGGTDPRGGTFTRAAFIVSDEALSVR